MMTFVINLKELQNRLIDAFIGKLHFDTIGYEVVNHCLLLSRIVIFASVGLKVMFG